MNSKDIGGAGCTSTSVAASNSNNSLSSSWLKDVASDPLRAAQAGIVRHDSGLLAPYDALQYPWTYSHPMVMTAQGLGTGAFTMTTSSLGSRNINDLNGRLLIPASSHNPIASPHPPLKTSTREKDNIKYDTSGTDNDNSAKRIKLESSSQPSQPANIGQFGGAMQELRPHEQYRNTSGCSQSTESSIPHRPDYFRKGSVIQLGDNKLKLIEDLQTSDFEGSAQLSPNLCLDCSVVTKITEDNIRGTAFLTFCVGDRKVEQIEATVEATLEHPFFVFDRGWSSVNPKRTLNYYQLPCHKLEVNDRCISLTHKEPVRDQESAAKSFQPEDRKWDLH